MKKVSVVVPCHNAGQYLDQCVDYLLRQTIGLEHMEIILVDDASTDGGVTRRKILEYERSFPDTILAVLLEQNMRQGGARNAGMFYAGGEYLCFCDVDDWLVEEAMEHCYLTAQRFDADVVEFAWKMVRERDVSFRPKEGNRSKMILVDSEEARKWFLMFVDDELTYGSQKKFFRMSMIRENYITFAEHLIFEEPSFVVPVRMYEKRHCYLDEQLYVWYLSPDSTTRGNWETEHSLDNLRVWQSLIQDISDRGLLEQYYPEMEYKFFSWGLGMSLKLPLQKGCVLNKDFLKIHVDATLQLFPDVRKNVYINMAAAPADQVLLELLDLELTDENVRYVNQAMLRCI